MRGGLGNDQSYVDYQLWGSMRNVASLSHVDVYSSLLHESQAAILNQADFSLSPASRRSFFVQERSTRKRVVGCANARDPVNVAHWGVNRPYAVAHS